MKKLLLLTISLLTANAFAQSFNEAQSALAAHHTELTAAKQRAVEHAHNLKNHHAQIIAAQARGDHTKVATLTDELEALVNQRPEVVESCHQCFKGLASAVRKASLHHEVHHMGDTFHIKPRGETTTAPVMGGHRMGSVRG